jgi:hypothetical protein
MHCLNRHAIERKWKTPDSVYLVNGLNGANTKEVEASADDILAQLSFSADWMPFTSGAKKKELVLILEQGQSLTQIYSRGLPIFNAEEKAADLYSRLIS